MAHQRKWFIKSRQDRQKREELADKLDDDTTALAVEVVIATKQQIRDFEIKLEQYETATVTALMENQKQLDVVNTQIKEMLNQAYVMEDGRRVFKTEDGTQVFDEKGKSVSRNELNYNVIGLEHTTWESYKGANDLRDQLEAQKEKILDFQETLDETRERVSEGDIFVEELEEMDAELLDLMPDTVKTHVSGVDTPTVTTDMTSADKKPDVTQSASPFVLAPDPIW